MHLSTRTPVHMNTNPLRLPPVPCSLFPGSFSPQGTQEEFHSFAEADPGAAFGDGCHVLYSICTWQEMVLWGQTSRN